METLIAELKPIVEELIALGAKKDFGQQFRVRLALAIVITAEYYLRAAISPLPVGATDLAELEELADKLVTLVDEPSVEESQPIGAQMFPAFRILQLLLLLARSYPELKKLVEYIKDLLDGEKE